MHGLDGSCSSAHQPNGKSESSITERVIDIYGVLYLVYEGSVPAGRPLLLCRVELADDLVDVGHDLDRLTENEEQRDEHQDARQVILTQLAAKGSSINDIRKIIKFFTPSDPPLSLFFCF